MRIAIFTDTFLPQINGVTNTLKRMQQYMDKNDIEYLFLTPRNMALKENMHNNISFQSMKFFLYPECRIAFPVYSEVVKQMSAFKPDVIHLVTPFSIGMTGLKYAREHDIPITTSYTMDFPQSLSYYHLGFLEPALWKFFKWFHAYAAINFVPSLHSAERLKAQGINNLEIWGRGIDIENFSPAFFSRELRNQYARDNEALLIYVGRLAPEKEMERILGALEILDKRKIKYKFLFVGDGPLRAALEEKNMANVRFLGYKSGRELKSLYAIADIFVFASRIETYGNVILEAMSSGVPVVAVFEGGVKENLIDNYNGVACRGGDERGMADAIGKLIDNEDLRKKMADNARTHAATKNWDALFASLFHQFDMLLEDTSYHAGEKVS